MYQHIISIWLQGVIQKAVVASDGYVYDERHIKCERWSPVTKVLLASNKLTVTHDLQSLLHAVARHRQQ